MDSIIELISFQQKTAQNLAKRHHKCPLCEKNEFKWLTVKGESGKVDSLTPVCVCNAPVLQNDGTNPEMEAIPVNNKRSEIQLHVLNFEPHVIIFKFSECLMYHILKGEDILEDNRETDPMADDDFLNTTEDEVKSEIGT